MNFLPKILHCFDAYTHEKIIDLLLRNGVNINNVNQNQQNALMLYLETSA